MCRRPPRSTRTVTLFPYTTLFRSSIISSAMSGENIQDVPLDTFSATFLAEIESLLNTQHEDRYLFAGSQTNTRAVDLSDAAYTPQAGLPGTFTADLDYYQGDTLQLSVSSAERSEEHTSELQSLMR